MKCSRCGSETTGKFCPKCGNKMEDNYGQKSFAQNANTHRPPAKKKGNKALIAVICSLAVLILAGIVAAGVFFFSSSSNEDDSEPNEKQTQTESKSEKNSKSESKTEKKSTKKSKKDDDDDDEDDKKNSKDDDDEDDKKNSKDDDDEDDKKNSKDDDDEDDKKYLRDDEEKTSRTGIELNYGNNEYLYPTNKKYLSAEELRGLSQTEVALLRNEIYARHGYVFQTEYYNNFFSRKSWYHPNSSANTNIESQLNAYELANKDLIVQYEAAMGWR